MTTITAAMVKELRDLTGSRMMECKKALEEANGNLQDAVTILRKRGEAEVSKRSGKTAAEGSIETAVSKDQKRALMIEINCETDFVARDSNFKKFAQDITALGLQNNVTSVEALLNLPYADSGKTIEQARQELMTKIGENIQIRRLASLSSQGVVGSYTHTNRIGVIVALSKENPQLAKDIAMHIAASNPQAINKEAVPAEIMQREYEIYKAQAKETGKPEQIMEKIIAGRIDKFLQDACLVSQAFIKNPDQTVGDLLQANNAEITAFVRFEVGEGIEKETVDFAAEVQAQIRGN